MRVKGIFTETDKRNGKVFIVVSKTWPDGERFRRRCPNKTVANNLIARINAAIAEARWKELRKELVSPVEPVTDYTIEEFGKVYLEEYCKKRNTRPDFKEETLEVISRIVGDVKLQEFTRADAQDFENQRSTEVAPATVNRGLAVLSNLLTFAFKKGLIAVHPMALYGRLPVDETARRYMTVEEERSLIQAVLAEDPAVGAFVAILGETGLRMEEGLNLKWEHVDTGNRMLTVAASKNRKIRHVPLSDFALEVLKWITRVVGQPWLFVRLPRSPKGKASRLLAPRKEFEAGKAAAGVSWVKGFHDLRHFRASQWIRNGVDIRTVKELLGHDSIDTTMIYAHFDPKHAFKAVLESQRSEVAVASGNR